MYERFSRDNVLVMLYHVELYCYIHTYNCSENNNEKNE